MPSKYVIPFKLPLYINEVLKTVLGRMRSQYLREVAKALCLHTLLSGDMLVKELIRMSKLYPNVVTTTFAGDRETLELMDLVYERYKITRSMMARAAAMYIYEYLLDDYSNVNSTGVKYIRVYG